MKALHAVTLFLAGEVMATPIVLPFFHPSQDKMAGVGADNANTTDLPEDNVSSHEKRELSGGSKAAIIMGTLGIGTLLWAGPELVGKIFGFPELLTKRDERNRGGAKADFHDDVIKTLLPMVSQIHSGKVESLDDFQDAEPDLTDLHEYQRQEFDEKNKTAISLAAVGTLLVAPVVWELDGVDWAAPYVPAEHVSAKRDVDQGGAAQQSTTMEPEYPVVHWQQKRLSTGAKMGIAAGALGFITFFGLLPGGLNPFSSFVDVPWNMAKRDMVEPNEPRPHKALLLSQGEAQWHREQLANLEKRGSGSLNTGQIIGISIAALIGLWGFSYGLLPANVPLEKRGVDLSPPAVTSPADVQQHRERLMTVLARPKAPEEFKNVILKHAKDLTVDDTEHLWNLTSTVMYKDMARLCTKHMH